MADHLLTPYQRGNRDGLLSFAAQLEVEAAHHVARADDLQARVVSQGRPEHGIHAEAARMATWCAEHMLRVAELARRAAEALPEDPALSCAPSDEKGA